MPATNLCDTKELTMPSNPPAPAPSERLITDLIQALDNLFGLHPGFRPVHAKGVICAGSFTPSAEAANLTRAPHASRPSTPVIVRFSNFAGIPTIPDNDPGLAAPRGFAVRFDLAPHVHTDIIGHSENGFPVRTGEEFVELARALAASGPTAPKPTALDKYLPSHPIALHFLTALKPFPTSFARESFFGVSAYKFTNQQNKSQFGRFKILPESGTEYLSNEAAAKKSPNYLCDEIAERLSKSPAKIRIAVQLAGEGDNVNDATNVWPDSRPEIDFGTVKVSKFANQNDPELRKIIFDPIPRVDGIEPSNDPLIAVRAALYLVTGRRRRAAISS